MNLVEVALLTGWVGVMGCITVNINFPPKEIEKAADVIVGEARPPAGGGDGGLSEPAPSGSEGAATPGPTAPQPPSEPEGRGAAAPPAVHGPEGTAAPSSRELGSPAGDVEVPGGKEGGTPPAPPEDGARASREGIGRGRSLLVSFAPAFTAAEEEKKASPKKEDIKINIETPVIKKIRGSLVARFKKLEPFYEKGAIGENLEGYLEIRDDSKLNLTEKRDLKALVPEENKDRKNLYLEIVKANGFEEDRLKDVQKIFAAQWAEKSRVGWWVQSKEGKWEKKAPPKDVKKKA